MLWKSGRQPFPTLSPAESELLELTEERSMADAYNALVMEHEENYDRTLYCNNVAAVSLASEP